MDLPSIIAHGVGGRSDLPLPLLGVSIGAGLAVALSFAIMGIIWMKPRLDRLSEGVLIPAGVDSALKIVGLVARLAVFVLYLAVIGAAFTGVDNPAENLATTTVFIMLWVVMQAASAVFGDIWSAVNPLDTIVAGIERLTGRRTSPNDDDGANITHWPAVIGLFGFLWLELAYHSGDSPETVGRAILAYSVVLVAGGLMNGRAWLRHAGGFSAWFNTLGYLGIFFRDNEGSLRIRPPFVGLSQMVIRPGTTALVLLVLGSTTFDGLGGTTFWQQLVRNQIEWGSTFASTGGLLWMLFVVTVVYLLVTRRIDTADRYSPSLVPIALGYIVAHYFSLVMFFGQGFFFGLSDPFDQGWDLLNNTSSTIDFTVVSTDLISWVQISAIVIGHILGVAASHDLVLEDEVTGSPDGLNPGATAFRAELPLAMVMMFYTSIGLYILMNS